MSNAAILACWRESPLEIDQDINGEVWTQVGGLYRLLVQSIVPGHEIVYGLQWLQSVLSGDVALATYAPGGVWRALAPMGTATPYVIVGFQAGTDVLTINVVRLMVNPLYRVLVVGPGSAAQIGTLVSAASEIDSLLARASGAI